jgi:hypothetical protein
VALTLFEEAAFWRLATLTVCQTHLGDLEKVRHALDRAIVLDPTFAQDRRGAFAGTAPPKIWSTGSWSELRKAGLGESVI